MDEFTTVNAVQESGEGFQEATQATDEGVTSATAEQRQPQTKEQNSAYAAARREAEAQLKALEQNIQAITQYTGHSSIDELLNDIKEANTAKEAEDSGVDVETYSRMKQLETEKMTAQQKLEHYERVELLTQQEKQISSDPKWSGFYKDNRDAIMQIAEENKCDLEVAKLVLFNTKGDFDYSALEQKAVEKYLAKLKKQNVPVEGRGGATPTIMQNPLNSKDPWAAASKSAKDIFMQRKL